MTGKNIVICCDGTGNEYGENNTNVVRTAEICIRNDQQLVYYDPGVGTGGFNYGKIKQMAGGSTGKGLQKNIEDAYRFLMKTYQPGDRIYLFGFSRGAFTVRSLAGMLYRVGLLYEHTENLVEYASKIYNRRNDNLDDEFKQNFCRQCPTHFIGVWDTVESLAADASDRFHDADLNPDTRYAYHAVAIDEKRKKFPPSLWNEENEENKNNKENNKEQTIEQVWFAGVHSDVGGWYKDRGLSDIALEWMLRNAENAGLKLEHSKMKEIKPDPTAKQHKSHIDGWKTILWRATGIRGRQVPEKAKVHSSVQTRMNSTDYQPVKPIPKSVQWVDTP